MNGEAITDAPLWTMRATREITYQIVETTDIFNPTNPKLLMQPGGVESTPGDTRVVILDEVVEQVYGEQIRHYFDANDVKVSYLVLAGGDTNKTIDSALKVASHLNEVGTSRVGNAPIGIGGGVLQDVVGMAVSLYRRGIAYTRVPTTLLGQIDGGVAIKTGVNYEGYRNRLGTFAPPPLTLIDRGLIATVPERQISSGLGEALKIAMVKDARLFEILEEHGPALLENRFQDPDFTGPDLPPGREVIQRSIIAMAEELEKNLWETDLQRIADYGHTFSPLIEMRALPELMHGEAVALGSVFCAVLAKQRGLLSSEDFDRIVTTARGLGLATSHPLFCDTDILMEGFEDTIRHRGGNQHLALLTGIGETVFVNDVTRDDVAAAAEEMRALLGELAGVPA